MSAPLSAGCQYLSLGGETSPPSLPGLLLPDPLLTVTGEVALVLPLPEADNTAICFIRQGLEVE